MDGEMHLTFEGFYTKSLIIQQQGWAACYYTNHSISIQSVKIILTRRRRQRMVPTQGFSYF